MTKKPFRIITGLAIIRIIAKIVSIVFLVWLMIYACTSINNSVKSNDSTIMREFGKIISETKSEFEKGLEEGK